ncbi:MAG: NAD(P)H-hydrate dehydratase [Deltaproteobacteria bacterium]|nr:MAG: NAD(P)H-hydrate dehydratase [Deltaproteobacteria bacterium]
MKLVTAAEMRELDRKAIEEAGIPSLVLMENAGRTTYQILRREFPDPGPVAVAAGRGNNGGDGSVVARYLAQAGIPVVIFLVAARDQVKGDALVNLEIAARLGIEIAEVREEKDLNPLAHRLARSGLIVDALLGTGLNSEVKGLMRQVIDEINRMRPPVLAVDIPSGLCSDTGQPLGAAVKARVTATYGWPKIGQILPPGRDYAGRLWQVDISIPPELARETPAELAEAKELRALLPPRPWGGHKGNFGHLVVIAGSEGKTGAAALASEAAVRSGAGLVTLGVPASLNDILEAKITEAMTLPLPEAIGERALGMKALEPLKNFLENKTAAALGPGLGTHPETGELVRRLTRELPLPMVIDADGVNALAAAPELLKTAAGPRILTPHPGEMARFLGTTAREVQTDRLGTARKAAALTGAVVVLKGAQTLVADATGRVSVNSTGNPALASGGTGDVLTGLIGGFLAQKLDPWDAARLGVYLHGLAADYFVDQIGSRGLIAGDLLAIFPEVFGEFIRGDFPPTEEDICYKLVIS